MMIEQKVFRPPRRRSDPSWVTSVGHFSGHSRGSLLVVFLQSFILVLILYLYLLLLHLEYQVFDLSVGGHEDSVSTRSGSKRISTTASKIRCEKGRPKRGHFQKNSIIGCANGYAVAEKKEGKVSPRGTPLRRRWEALVGTSWAFHRVIIGLVGKAQGSLFAVLSYYSFVLFGCLTSLF